VIGPQINANTFSDCSHVKKSINIWCWHFICGPMIVNDFSIFLLIIFTYIESDTKAKKVVIEEQHIIMCAHALASYMAVKLTKRQNRVQFLASTKMVYLGLRHRFTFSIVCGSPKLNPNINIVGNWYILTKFSSH
jgi:hypothetical protein